MGAISVNTNFFHHDAAQQKQGSQREDHLEQAVIACERKDAAILRQALHSFVAWLRKPEDDKPDALESAILACQRRDRTVLSNLLNGH